MIPPSAIGEFTGRGLRTPEAVCDLAGEVVSGHPDRHVVQVAWPGASASGVAYLKRQHRVRFKERWRNALAGFGFISKSEREARLLKALHAAGFDVPQPLAHGETADGRAFLLLGDVPGVVELRQFLADGLASAEDRCRCAEQLGTLLAELHAAGFHNPDLTVKHVLVHPRTLRLTVIDWPSSRRLPHVPESLRRRSLAALHGSLADGLATLEERFRVLWAYRRVQRLAEPTLPCQRLREVLPEVLRQAGRLRQRRSMRDQRESPARPAQRLVWLAGEAACVVPDVAALWPRPADGTPFYDATRPADRLATQHVTLTDGRVGWLVRGHSFAPFSRFRAAVRGKPWRSPELKLARVFFHLERYGVPAPRLLAFGQKLTSPTRAEGFVLYEPPTDGIDWRGWLRKHDDNDSRARILEAIGSMMRRLHESGCVLDGERADEPLFHVTPFAERSPVRLGAVRSVRLVKRLTCSERQRDVRRLMSEMPDDQDQRHFVRGYES